MMLITGSSSLIHLVAVDVPSAAAASTTTATGLATTAAAASESPGPGPREAVEGPRGGGHLRPHHEQPPLVPGSGPSGGSGSGRRADGLCLHPGLPRCHRVQLVKSWNDCKQEEKNGGHFISSEEKVSEIGILTKLHINRI